MDDRQLIADLLSALEYHTEQTRPIEFSKVAIKAAREHLRRPAPRIVDCHATGVCVQSGLRAEQPAQQKPVATMKMLHTYGDTAPPQRKPLTDEKIRNLWDGHVVPVFGKNGINPIVFARAIEAAHGIKENT